MADSPHPHSTEGPAGPVAVDEASARRGMEMVSSRKVDCLDCHTINGAGGSVGPDLSAFGKQNKSVAYLESNPYIADPAKYRNDIMPAYGGSLKKPEREWGTDWRRPEWDRE